MFENLGIPHEVVFFFGIFANSQVSTPLASSFGHDHSKLDISRKDDCDSHPCRNTLEPLYLYVDEY